MSVMHQDKGWAMRLATDADNLRLCEIFRDVRMKGELDLAQERDPDFFALLRMQEADSSTWVAVDEADRIIGCGSIIVRDAWFNGGIVRVGYTSDLRKDPAAGRARALPVAYRVALDHVRNAHNCKLFYTAVIDSNLLWMNAIEHSRTRRSSQFPYHAEMTKYAMVSLQFTTSKPKPRGSVVHATADDIPALARFLGEQQKSRVFGYVIDEAALRGRISRWPGLTIESFLLARDVEGRIIGCVAPYSTGRVKRTRVMGYAGKTKTLKMAYNALATVARFPKLPQPGELFKFTFLTHLEALDDDARIYRDLLLQAYGEQRKLGLHFTSCMVPTGSTLSQAVEGFFTQRTPMSLYAVLPKDSALREHDFRTLRPGFEMALS